MNVPKRDVVAWVYRVCESYKMSEESVECFKTSRPSFTSPVLLAGGPYLPYPLRNRQPVFYVGKTDSGANSNDILKVRSVQIPGTDNASITDTGSPVFPGVATTVTWTDKRTGTVLPKWRAVIRAGGNATTPMHGERGSLESFPGHMVVRFKRDYDKKVNQVATSKYVVATPSVFSVAGTVNNSTTRALAKLHSKIYDLQHDARIGESLGEYKQAMRMVGRPLNGLKTLVEVYRRRAAEVSRNAVRRVGKPISRFDKRDLNDVSAALAGLYLEFNFGWKPLALDLKAALAAVNKARGSIATVLNASYAGDDVYSDQTISDLENSYCYFKTRWVKRFKVTVRYKVGIDPVKVLVGGYLERVGLTPQEFIPTVYAVLPYSWLFDYFTNVNVVVDSLMSELSFTTWTCKTVRKSCMTEATANPDVAKAASVLGASFLGATGLPCVARAVMVTVDRSTPTDLIASPTIAMPKTGKPYANMAALALSKKYSNLRGVIDSVLTTGLGAS